MSSALKKYIRKILNNLLEESENIPCRLQIVSDGNIDQILDTLFADGIINTPVGNFKKVQTTLCDGGVEILGDITPEEKTSDEIVPLLKQHFKKLFSKFPVKINSFDVSLLQRINEQE